MFSQSWVDKPLPVEHRERYQTHCRLQIFPSYFQHRGRLIKLCKVCILVVARVGRASVPLPATINPPCSRHRHRGGRYALLTSHHIQHKTPFKHLQSIFSTRRCGKIIDARHCDVGVFMSVFPCLGIYLSGSGWSRVRGTTH